MNRTFFLLALSVFLLLAACSTDDVSKAPKGYRSQGTMKIAYATGMLKLIEAEPEIPASLESHLDLIYKTTPEKELKLDLYYPKDLSQSTPLLLFIHGGSWKKGNKDDYRRYLVDFAEKGYVTASVSYRFSQEAAHPAALEDVVCGLQWLKDHAADYQIDTNKVAVVGGSAGGHLGMLLAYHTRDSTFISSSPCGSKASTKIQALVNFYGPTDLTTPYAREHPSVSDFIGVSYSTDTHSKYANASPLQYVSADDPPTLTFHGTLDDLVPVSQADTLDQALTAVGVASQYHRLKGWPHTLDLGLKVNRFCQHHMDAFFESYLK
ncbi:MAG: alpha/beta hydrolase [Saprospiraceae bacterium]|nr:alpha/beta hydrolase [Saprospiraceae bacterium]